ncbi:MAG: DNA-primase RepB domain-containing protein [Candidatus Binataceae bacterium]
MSASATQSVVRKHLRAMGCELFEIGVLRLDGRMLLRSGWSADQIDAALAWLRWENARGAQIFVRPHGSHALSLVDDLSADTIPRMTDAGFQPAAVVETSPRNFQVWLNHGRILFDRTFSTHAAKELARRFGGDPSSADWRHFGRLAGFTNQKPNRRLRTGLPPFVRLHECEGLAYRAAREFLEEVKSLVHEAGTECSPRTICGTASEENSVRPLPEFHGDPRYSGDLHRADMAWALHAASRGLPEQQIRDEILHGRDLSKKGRPRRQLDYAQRTAIKAVVTVEPPR